MSDDDQAPAGPSAPRPPGRPPTGRSPRPAPTPPRLRVLLGLLPPRGGRGQLAAGLLCLLLGFALAAQVQSNRAGSTFATARQDELVGILSDLSQRSERLRGDIRELLDTKARLERDRQGATAVEEARQRAASYGILAGTVPATGPGIELVIEDPYRRVRADVLLDTLEELRDAGAEVIQIGGVRVGVDTYFRDVPGDGSGDGSAGGSASRTAGVEIDGQTVTPPYRFLVIGDPHTMSTALNIPGGVVKSLHNVGAHAAITQRDKVTITAVRSP